MNALPKFLLSIMLASSATITESTFAKSPNELEEISLTNPMAKPELDKATATESTIAKDPSDLEKISCTNPMSKSELDKAFISAVRSYDFKKMQELIAAGADVNVSISHTWTAGDCDWQIESSPLIFAIKNNQPMMVKILLQVKNKLSTTLGHALDEALDEGRSAIVEELIKEGADVNFIYTENNDTPLILAIKHARPLSEFCRQAQERSKSRWEERKKIIQILLKAGANINHVNKHGSTALMEAIKKHDLNTVLDLLKFPEITTGSFFGFGKKPINHADKDGNTALIIAVKNIRTSYIAGNSQEYNTCLNSQKIVEALFKTPDIDPYLVNNKGETAIALFEAASKKYNH